MADWEAVAGIATARGTLALAAATFSAVRSSNRSARLAERSLLTGMRPLLLVSLVDDPVQKVLWRDRHVAQLRGGRAIAEVQDGVIYLAIGLRNVGAGIALLHGWYPRPHFATSDNQPADVDAFRRLTIDLYIAPGAAGYWESALRDETEPVYAECTRVLAEREPFTIDVLYGDQEGGQRTISRCIVLPASDDGWYCQVARHWQVDRDDPR